MNTNTRQSKQALSSINSQMNSSSNKFNAYKIKTNYLDFDRLNDENYDYEFEEKKKINSHNKIRNLLQIKQIQKQGNFVPNQQNFIKQSKNDFKCLLDELTFPNKNSCKIILKQKQNHETQKKQQNLDDDLWRMIQQELNNNSQQKIHNQQQKYLPQASKFQNERNSKKLNNVESEQSSSCQFTKQQLQQMMQLCQEPTSNASQNSKALETSSIRHQIRSNCVYFNEEILQSNNSDNSWGDINDQLNRDEHQSSSHQIPHNSELYLANIQYKCESQTDQLGFVIIDGSPIFPTHDVALQCQQITKSNQKYEKACKYGPWQFTNQLYSAHKYFQFQAVQNLMPFKKRFQSSKSREQLIYQSEKPLRKINWQIMEQKKSQVKSLKSKRHCKTTLIQHGKDFLIYDHYKFMSNPIREGVHLYLGVRSFGDFSESNQSVYGSKKQLENQAYIKDYLYFSSSGQCLLETDYHFNPCEAFPSNIDKFDILLSLTKQKIAVCERFVSNSEKDRRQCIQVRYYDRFQNSQAQYIGLIQSRISKFNEQWFCDTSIYTPKKKIYSNKSNDKNWERLKMQLRVSEMGTIVAQLGIFDAKSSVTNCILFNENKTSQFMMGTIQQNQQQINYVVRVEGLSPILAFASVISRKLFVFSS